jgi:hypothetical protein
MSPRSDELLHAAQARLVEPLHNTQALREAVDYDAKQIGDEEARELLDAAQRLATAVEEAFGDR